MIATALRFIRIGLGGADVVHCEECIRYFRNNESAIATVCRWNSQTAVGAMPRWYYAICGLDRAELAGTFGTDILVQPDGEIVGNFQATLAK